ncbi:THIF-type NAD/FAD binding fold domain-containing protein [Plasmodiophora brassicae]|nr:hypothetical protein PBRA_006088 [Plasmodiophora brassicae]
MAVDEAANGNLITDEEARLYDRQIRVWGMDAQNRMRRSHVLVCGLNSIHGEVCKNIVLAGVGALTILDHRVVTEDDDVSAYFLCNTDDCGKFRALTMAPRLAELNPNVKIHTVTDALEACAPEFFDQFDVISLSGYGLSTISAVENIARSSSNAPAVFVTEPNNFDAWFAQNLHQHKFVRVTKGEDGADDVHVNDEATFPALAEVFSCPASDVLKAAGRRMKSTAAQFLSIRLIYEFEREQSRWPASTDMDTLMEMRSTLIENERLDSRTFDQTVLRNVAGNWGLESAPSSAIIGGVLGQEILKTITHKDPPLSNFTFLSGMDGSVNNVHVQRSASASP